MSRGRGEYGPLDRDRHFVIGWGADHATSYAAAKALAPIVPTLDVIGRTKYGARRAWAGAQQLGNRTCAERPKETGISSTITMIAGGVGLVIGFIALRGALRDMHDMVE